MTTVPMTDSVLVALGGVEFVQGSGGDPSSTAPLLALRVATLCLALPSGGW